MNKKKIGIIAAVCAGVVSLSAVGIYAAEHLSQASAITKEDAYRFALLDAEVNAADAVLVKSEYDIEHGTAVFDIEFTANGTKYDYDVNAADGTITERSSKPIRMVNETAAAIPGTAAEPVNSAVLLTEDEALNAAFTKAGVSGDSVTVTKIRLEKDDGRDVYDIEFAVPGEMEYDFEIDASTGAILEESTERIKQVQVQAQVPTVPTDAAAATPATTLTVEDAKAIALNHAGKKAEDVVFSKAKCEKDDGRWIFEVEFHVTGLTEYEYEIDAVSGEILEADVEAWDD